ncbi:MAG: hypothetical protein SFW07_04880 [Gammaproteobacteria bacterium]|nr:hypothetical protein [Gammaproteobacteria bacterium]
MLEQTENLRSQIKRAIREYESLFTENKPMPEHRCIDVVDLRIILDRHYDDLSSCIDAVKQRLSIIKTGWWIFKTGRSRLRSGITPILQAYENPITQHLVTQILGISQSLNDVVEELRESRSGKIPVLSINHQSTSDGETYEFDDNDGRSPLFAFSVEERESAGFRIRK